mgnify:FL=1
MNNQLHEATKFFKSEKVYDKLFEAFRKKYESLGRIGGTVPIGNFSKNELEEIGKFFGLPGEQLEMKGSISLRAFEKQFEYTRFSSVTLKQLLDSYFGERLISNKEQRMIREASLREYLLEQQVQYPQLAFWLQFLLEQKREGRWIVQIAEQENTRFNMLLELLNRAFNTLPQQAERLPMFSQRITGDPHAFDLQTDLGRMFIHLLSVHRAGLEEGTMMEIPVSTEEINELLEQYHIYRDDLLNFVTCANLVAETAAGLHPVWKAAVKEQTVQIVPLRELVSLVSAYPMEGDVVWVVENSGVCATLLDYKPDAPIICTNGQFTLATWLLMDLLVKNACKLYYAGDFDPEGLGMAQRLLDRYSDSVHLWHMNKAGYRKTKPSKELSNERLEKLKGITDDGLLEVAEEMKLVGKAGYQEALVDWMMEDMKGKEMT